VEIIGILNITTDSFSDGSYYLNPQTAIKKGLSLAAQGADLIDVGAESTSPDSEKISPQQEIARLTPVIKALKEEGIRISVDTYKPEVMERVISLGVDMINDVSGLRNKSSLEIIRQANIPVVVMFSNHLSFSAEGVRAQREFYEPSTIMSEIEEFFTQKLQQLHEAGIADDKVIIDPGMGAFLAANPEPSLVVLHHLQMLKKFGRRILISTSRKSFIGAVLNRPIESRIYGTLATEIWAYWQGVDFIRTHDVAALKDALRMIQAIEQVKHLPGMNRFRK